MEHFSEFQDKIKDVRIPKKSDDKKSAIAFIEVADEPTYEVISFIYPKKNLSYFNNGFIWFSVGLECENKDDILSIKFRVLV